MLGLMDLNKLIGIWFNPAEPSVQLVAAIVGVGDASRRDECDVAQTRFMVGRIHRDILSQAPCCAGVASATALTSRRR